MNQASAMKVSNGEFWKFTSNGGYWKENYWTKSGWGWRSFRNVKVRKTNINLNYVGLY